MGTDAGTPFSYMEKMRRNSTDGCFRLTPMQAIVASTATAAQLIGFRIRSDADQRNGSGSRDLEEIDGSRCYKTGIRL